MECRELGGSLGVGLGRGGTCKGLGREMVPEGGTQPGGGAEVSWWMGHPGALLSLRKSSRGAVSQKQKRCGCLVALTPSCSRTSSSTRGSWRRTPTPSGTSA